MGTSMCLDGSGRSLLIASPPQSTITSGAWLCGLPRRRSSQGLSSTSSTLPEQRSVASFCLLNGKLDKPLSASNQTANRANRGRLSQKAQTEKRWSFIWGWAWMNSRGGPSSMFSILSSKATQRRKDSNFMSTLSFTPFGQSLEAYLHLTPSTKTKKRLQSLSTPSLSSPGKWKPTSCQCLTNGKPGSLQAFDQ
jgi:hypothetical protein